MVEGEKGEPNAIERLRELVENGYNGGSQSSATYAASRRLIRFIVSPEAVEVLANVICCGNADCFDGRGCSGPVRSVRRAERVLQLLALKGMGEA